MGRCAASSWPVMPPAEAAPADLYRFAVMEMTEDKEECHQAWRDRRRPRFIGR